MPCSKIQENYVNAPKSASSSIKIVTNTNKNTAKLKDGTTIYSCRYCEKRLIRKGHWEEHERIHTGEKPFKCTECSSSFSKKTNMKMHFKRVHEKSENI